MFYFKASKKSQLCFKSSPLLLALSAVSASQAQTLNSFESATDLAKGRVNCVQSKASLITTGATDGASACRVEFQPSTGYPEFGINTGTNSNFEATGGIAFDIVNPGNDRIDLGIGMRDASGNVIGSNFSVFSGQKLSFRSGADAINVDPSAYGMQALPNPFAGMTNLKFSKGTFDSKKVAYVWLFVRKPSASQSVIVDNFRLLAPFNLNSFLQGWVDKYGQNARLNYSGKVTADADLKSAAPSKAPLETTDLYGGWLNGPKQVATGFFRTEFVNGKWWMVTPTGSLFFSKGMTTVRAKEDTVIEGRESMFQGLPASTDPLAKYYGTQVPSKGLGAGKALKTFNFYGANLERKYGPNWMTNFRQDSQSRLKSWGFNTIAAFSDLSFQGNSQTPYTISLYTDGRSYNRVSTGVDYWITLPDPFDPKFSADLAKAFAFQAPPSKVANDPYVIGYTVDNELSWIGNGSDQSIGVAAGTLAQDSTKGGAKAALVKQLQNKYGPIANLNAAWGTSFASWDAFSKPNPITGKINASCTADLKNFVYLYAKTYFNTVKQAIRTNDPNHMYLGQKLGSYTDEVLKAYNEEADVCSINFYSDSPNNLAALKLASKPLLITEFHFGSTDRGNPFYGMVSAANLADRATCYSKFIKAAALNKWIVETTWYQYCDQPVTGRWFDGQNAGIGFVDVADKVQTALADGAAAANNGIHGLRYNGS